MAMAQYHKKKHKKGCMPKIPSHIILYLVVSGDASLMQSNPFWRHLLV